MHSYKRAKYVKCIRTKNINYTHNKTFLEKNESNFVIFEYEEKLNFDKINNIFSLKISYY